MWHLIRHFYQFFALKVWSFSTILALSIWFMNIIDFNDKKSYGSERLFIQGLQLQLLDKNNFCCNQTSHCSEFLKQPACSQEPDVFWGLSEASPDGFTITFKAFIQLHQFTWKCIFFKQFLPLKWKTDSNRPLTEFFILNKPF